MFRVFLTILTVLKQVLWLKLQKLCHFLGNPLLPNYRNSNIVLFFGQHICSSGYYSQKSARNIERLSRIEPVAAGFERWTLISRKYYFSKRFGECFLEEKTLPLRICRTSRWMCKLMYTFIEMAWFGAAYWPKTYWSKIWWYIFVESS